MQLSQTRTTMFLVTNTTRLRAYLRRVDPYTAGSLLIIALIIAGGLIRNALAGSPPAPIIVVATQALPGAGQHGTVRRLERAPAAQNLLPTAIVPTAPTLPTAQPVYQEMTAGGPVPTPAGYVAHTTDGDLFVPNDATPVPEGQPYTGPFLAPNVTEAPSGPRLCTGFGDWRDYDPAYAASPVCHKEAP